MNESFFRIISFENSFYTFRFILSFVGKLNKSSFMTNRMPIGMGICAFQFRENIIIYKNIYWPMKITFSTRCTILLNTLCAQRFNVCIVLHCNASHRIKNLIFCIRLNWLARVLNMQIILNIYGWDEKVELISKRTLSHFMRKTKKKKTLLIPQIKYCLIYR